MARGDTAQARINVTTNAEKAKNDIEEVNTLLKKLQKTKQLMMKEGLAIDKDGKETATFKKLNRDIKDTQENLKRLTDRQTLMNRTLGNLNDIKLKELKTRYRELTKELGTFTGRQSADAQKWRANLETIKAKITEIEGAGKGASKSMAGFGGSLKTTLKSLVAYAGVFTLFNQTKQKLTEIVKLNAEFSDQLANIRKVSNLPMDSINQLATNLAKIDTRSSVQQLNELAYTGAKLGFGNLGTEALEGFVKSAVVVQNALSEDMGADAMTALSKMVEVMGLIPKMGVEKAMNSVGSAIFKLASTSTATGTNIVEFSKRLMGLANIAHISSADLLALGSAADSMALMPEVAATAFNKLISSVQKQPNLIENALHMEPGTISNLFQAGRMTDALVEIFEKMREKGGMNALMQSGVFKDLGSDGARLVAVMATMSNRVDMLKEHLETARDAFAEGTAVGQEYAIQMETAEAYAERAANLWTKAFVNPEGVDVVKSLSKAWYDMSKQITESQGVMMVVKALLEGLIGTLKVIIQILPGIMSSLVALASVKGLMGIYQALFAVNTATVATTTAFQRFGLMLKTNWVGWLVTAIGLLGQFAFTLMSAKNRMDEASGAMPGFKKDLSDLNVEFGTAVSRLDRFRDAILQAEMGTKERAAAIRNFKQQYGQYLSQMITEESSAYAIARAYNEVTKALRAKIALQMKEDDINKQVAPREAWAASRREEYNKYMGNSQYNGTWLTGVVNDALTSGKSIQQLAKELNDKAFHLSDEIVENALRQTASGTYKDVKGVTTENGDIFRELNGQNLWRALRYATQSYSANTALNRVNEKWKPEQDLMNDMLARQNQSEQIDPLQNAPDKEAARAARKAQQDEKQALRKELQDAKQESDAIISKIEEWYRLQETTITAFAADGKWTQQQADVMIDQLNQAKNQALAAARHGISGRDTETWDVMKQQIGTLMFDTSDMSKHLLDDILKVRLENVRKSLSHIDKTGNQYGITSGSLRDSINKNAAGNLREVERIQKKSASEIEKMLKQYDFFQQAVDAFNNRLTQLGLLTESAAAAARRIQQAAAAEGTPEALRPDYRTAEQQEADYQRRRSEGMAAAASRFIAGGAQSMTVNYNDTAELDRWLRELTGAEGTIGTNGFEFQFASWADAFREDFDRWLHDSGKYKSEIQAFYLSLVQASDDYTEATKKAYEREKKLQDQRFEVAGYRDEEERRDTDFERQSKMQDALGTGQNFWQQNGLQDSIAADPEVQRIQNRIYYRNLEYEDAKRHLDQMLALQQQEYDAAVRAGQNQQQLDALREQQRQQRAGVEELAHQRETELFNATADLAAKVAQEIQTRTQTIQQLSQPISDFAEQAGQKLGDMMFNMESQSMTWEQMWKGMVLAMGKSVIQMGAQYLTQKLQQALFYKQMEADEATHQAIMTMIALGGATARMEGEAAINTASVATNAATNAAEVGQEVSLATILTALGISKGAAKIIGTLGWWGIPLIAVISSLLMGLLASALSTAGQESSSAAATPKTNVKLKSGMLTYDSGNVQQTIGSGSQWRGQNGEYISGSPRSVSGGSSAVSRPAPVLGDDGRFYRATPQPSLPEGVSIVRKPIATTVNGQQALVAERGPEIVIGRKTTRRLMMNEPGLLHALATADRGITTRRLRTFDEGNIADLAQAVGSVNGGTSAVPAPEGGSDSQQQDRIAAALEQNTQMMAAFTQMMANIQRNGIPAHINKYGRGGLIDEVQSGLKFVKKYQ